MRSIFVIRNTVLISICSFVTINCYPYGAPCAAFNNMKPSDVFHGTGLNPLTEPPPYEFVVLDSDSKPVKFYKLNATYTVQLKSLIKQFRGFMIQARLLIDNKLSGNRVGKFVPDISWGSKGIQLQDCEDVRKYDSVTHSNNEPKQSIEIVWQPSSQDGPVQFIVTIVEELHVYWEKWQPTNGYLFLAKAEIPTETGQSQELFPGEFQSTSTQKSLSLLNGSLIDDGSLKKTTSISTFVINFGNIDVVDRRNPQLPPAPLAPDERVNESKGKILNVFEIVTNETPQKQPVSEISVAKIDTPETNTEKVPFLFTTEPTTPNSPQSDVTDNFVVTESSNLINKFTIGNVATNLARFDLLTSTTTEKSETSVTDNLIVTESSHLRKKFPFGNVATNLPLAHFDLPTSTTTEKSDIFEGKFNAAGTTFAVNSSDPCSLFPCYNNATCKSRPDENTFECLCTERWIGAYCDVPNKCYSNKCLNGATCIIEDSNYTCQCPPNFAGDICEHHCPDYLCAHGGKCIVGSNQFFACQCAPGWTGEHCREEIDECASNPCKFGDCVNKVNGYQCQCPFGIMGSRCHRPCEDIYHSCPLWREEESCETFRNQTKFFDTNCASSCGICVANKTTNDDGNISFPPVLEPLLFLLGKWTFNSTSGQRFPIDLNGFSTYIMDIEFLPAAVNMFGSSSLKYRTRATNRRDLSDAQVTQGFMTLVPKGDNLRIALHSTGNDGVTMLEEGFLSDKRVALRTTDYFTIAKNDVDKVATNAGRTFEITEPYLKETIERVTADNVRFVFTNYYRPAQSYAPF